MILGYRKPIREVLTVYYLIKVQSAVVAGPDHISVCQYMCLCGRFLPLLISPDAKIRNWL